jgi:DNA-binding winged helix-turn-helix (wHTH) protein/Tfp pilus assembly protein PilF
VAAAYRFGPFLVDRAGYRVLRGHQALDLTPKLLDLLLHLLDHAGELVTKEALLDAIWPDANVTDNALAQAVSDLRNVLGDEPAEPKYIKTVARRGYRFVAPVTPLPEPAPSSEADTPGVADDTLAVLDFANVTGDENAAWLSAGIAETVSADLAALGRFKVIDRWRVVEAARGGGRALQDIAAALRVRLLVVGSFQVNVDRVRITARVVDVPSGEAVADAKVDGDLDDAFDLQDQVAAQFASELGIVTPQAGAARSRDTASLEAYRAVVEGWLKVETLDVRQLPAAIADFERAVAIDPKYAVAYTGLASAELASYESTRSDNHPARELLDRAAAHARRAIELDERLAEAHGSLAMILVGAWDTPGAIRAARRAVALEPDNWRHLFRLGHATWGDERLRAGAATLALYPDFAFSYFQTAMVHVARGHLGEAERVLQHGTAVQDRQIARGERYPALGLHWLLGLVRLAQDDIEEALDEFERERARAQPHRLYGREYSMYALLGRGSALFRSGRHAEAAAAFRDALALYPEHPLALIGAALSTGGSFAAAEAAIAGMRASKPVQAGIAKGALLAARGDPAGSAAALDAVLAAAPPGFAGWQIPVLPMFREVTETTAIKAVLDRLAERAR